MFGLAFEYAVTGEVGHHVSYFLLVMVPSKLRIMPCSTNLYKYELHGLFNVKAVSPLTFISTRDFCKYMNFGWFESNFVLFRYFSLRTIWHQRPKSCVLQVCLAGVVYTT